MDVWDPQDDLVPDGISVMDAVWGIVIAVALGLIIYGVFHG